VRREVIGHDGCPPVFEHQKSPLAPEALRRARLELARRCARESTGPPPKNVHRCEGYSHFVTDAKLPGFQERLAESRGGRLRYFVAGAGEPPVLLVHGLGGAAANWVELAPAL